MLWLQLTLFIGLMALSGFFSSSETALFSLSNRQIEQLRLEGHPRAALIARLLNAPRRLIITILIGNEFVNVSALVISAAVIIELLGAENKWANLFVMIPILLLVGRSPRRRWPSETRSHSRPSRLGRSSYSPG